LLAETYRDTKVISQRTQDGQLVLSARIDKSIAGRLKRAGAKVSTTWSS
jgi:hypothetical protein